MFYENLTHIIGEKYQNKIPMNSTLADSKERWNNYLTKLKFEVCTDSEFWLNYWTDNPCTTKPTPEDAEKLKRTPEELEKFNYTYQFALTDLHFCLCTSLKALIEDDKEGLESTENLHQWHLLLKKEMISRGYEGMTPTDSFEIEIAEKHSGHYITEKIKEVFRHSGDKCIHCGSVNIVSNGNMWTCKDCKKSFRKH